MLNMLAQLSWPQSLLALLIIFVCILLMIVILLQRGRGGGLSGAFGGGGGSAAFGAKTGDVFTWITVGFTTVFVLLTVVANYAFDEAAVPAAEQEQAETETVPVGEGAAGDGSGIQTIELGGDATGPDGQALPIKITPVQTPEGDPQAAGEPVLPGSEGNQGAQDGAAKQEGTDAAPTDDDGTGDESADETDDDGDGSGG